MVGLSFLMLKLGVVIVLCHSSVVRIKHGLLDESICARRDLCKDVHTALCAVDTGNKLKIHQSVNE